MHQIFENLNSNPALVFLLFLGFVFLNLACFLILGSKAEKKFNGLDLSEIAFREKGVSGYSKKSPLTKIGGASKVLDVIVTDTEFCIKGICGAFTYIGEKYDLTRRMPITNIKNVAQSGSEVEVAFHKGSNIVLRLKDVSGFIGAAQG